MSFYSLYEAAPVVNYGYFDVPINNNCSNKDIRDTQQTLNEYNFNSKINNTINDNKQKYLINQQPTVPSPSLYIESDNPAAGYYQNNKKKQATREHFTGSSAIDDYSHLYMTDNNAGSYTPSNSYGNYYATHEMQSGYLNEQTIPNISNVYLNSPVAQPSNTGRKSDSNMNQQNQHNQQHTMMGNSYQMQMKAAQDYARMAASENIQKLAKNIKKHKIVEKPVLLNKKKKRVLKKKVNNCQKNTLTGSVFMLSFVVLILALLIFFRHFK
jgi:hypothetical protein